MTSKTWTRPRCGTAESWRTSIDEFVQLVIVLRVEESEWSIQAQTPRPFWDTADEIVFIFLGVNEAAQDTLPLNNSSDLSNQLVSRPRCPYFHADLYRGDHSLCTAYEGHIDPHNARQMKFHYDDCTSNISRGCGKYIHKSSPYSNLNQTFRFYQSDTSALVAIRITLLHCIRVSYFCLLTLRLYILLRSYYWVFLIWDSWGSSG